MKNTLLIICLVLLTSTKASVIHGKINNNSVKNISVSIYLDPATNQSYEFVESVDSLGYYSIKLDIENPCEGIISLNNQSEFLLHLEPADSLYILSDELRPNDIPTVSQNLSGNKFICLNHWLFWLMEQQKRSIASAKKIDEEDLSNTIMNFDSYQNQIQLIDSLMERHPVTKIFDSFIRNKILYDYLHKQIDIPQFVRLFSRDKTKQVSIHPPQIDSLVRRYPIAKTELIHYSSYLTYTNAYLYILELEQTNWTAANGIKVYLSALDSITKNKTVKANLLAHKISLEIDRGNLQNVDILFTEFDMICTDEYLYRGIQSKIQKATALAPGQIAPGINSIDADGNLFNLRKLSSKHVYMNFWSTSCGPCILEMSAHKKLFSKFSNDNIVFLHVSLDKDEKVWRDAIKKHALEGVNIRYSDATDSGVTSYKIGSIPRYILLGKGNVIIDNNAPRPSDKRLTQFLEETRK